MNRCRDPGRTKVFSRDTWRGFTRLDVIPKAEMVGRDPINYTGKPPIFLSIVYLGVVALNLGLLAGLVSAAGHGDIAGIVGAGVLAVLFIGINVLITFPLRRIWYYWILVRRQKRARAAESGE
jgi:hypothetical protein